MTVSVAPPAIAQTSSFTPRFSSEELSRSAFSLAFKGVALGICLLFGSAAWAQNSGATSGSNSQSAATVNQVTNTPDRQRIDTTASGIAPGLTAAGVHACAGSASGGVGMTGINIGFGSTKEMLECNRRAYAASLQGLGQNAAALEMLCQNEEVRAALNVTGVICPGQQAAARAAAAKSVSKSTQGRTTITMTRDELRARGCVLKVSDRHGRHWGCPHDFRDR